MLDEKVLTELSDVDLIFKHAASHHVVEKSTDALIDHHLICAELTKRKIAHGHVEGDAWSEPIEFEKSEHHPIKALVAKAADLPDDLITQLREAMEAGYTFTDVLAILTVNGYAFTIAPIDGTDPDDDGDSDALMNCPDCSTDACGCADGDCSCWSGCTCDCNPAQATAKAAVCSKCQGGCPCSDNATCGCSDSCACIGCPSSKAAKSVDVHVDTKGQNPSVVEQIIKAVVAKFDTALGLTPEPAIVSPFGKSFDRGEVIKADTAKRFTLAPMYVPNQLDAHGEWTDPDELQKAAWEYVKSGNRDIRLQHNTEIVAGEWLEIMTMPYEVTFPMFKADGTSEDVTYPANTVFMGVQWRPWAWELVKSQKIRGLSIGGTAARIEADIPTKE